MIAIRRMQNPEIERIAELDRSEHVRKIYVIRDGSLIQKDVDWHIPRWSQHMVQAKIEAWRPMLAQGSSMFGAFDGKALIGFSIYRPNLSQDTAQLGELYVSKDYRGQGIGALLLDKVVELARADGASKLYVSSTPTTATADFYMSNGFDLTKEINQYLYELEPEDIHMIKIL